MLDELLKQKIHLQQNLHLLWEQVLFQCRVSYNNNTTLIFLEFNNSIIEQLKYLNQDLRQMQGQYNNNISRVQMREGKSMVDSNI